MTDELTALRDQMVAACRRLAATGLSPGGSGNVSVLAGDRVLITPTGSALARVRPAELAVVGIDGASDDGPRPSKELPLHLAIHRAASSSSAVVHLHSPFATAISCLAPDGSGRAALPAFTPYRVLRLGAIPLVPYSPPGSFDLAAGVAQHAGAPALLLARHGSVVAAADVDAAGDLAEELENAAQVALLLAGSAAAPLGPDEIARLERRA